MPKRRISLADLNRTALGQGQALLGAIPPLPLQALAALPECTDEDFERNKAAWRALITSSKKTPAGLIAMLSTRAVLSEAQKLTIDSWAHEND
eukprot:gene37763-46594_t